MTDPLAIGARVGDYVLDAELPGRDGERAFVSTHVVLPRRARIVIPSEPDRAVATACLLETLRHPTIPRVYECGLLPDYRTWLAMAVVDGPSLAGALADRALSVIDAIAVISDLAAVLAHAHSLGVVHGSLDVRHVIHTPTGWRITDWSGALLDGDVRIDVRALGGIAYTALARQLPSMPLRRRCPGVPEPLAVLIDRMLDAPPPAEWVVAEVAHVAEITEQPAADDAADGIEAIEIVDLVLPKPSC